MEDQDVEPTPDVTWWTLMHMRAQSQLWAIQHWMATRLCGLRICHSCAGYFDAVGMMTPDTCEACYAHAWGVPGVYDPTVDRGK